jgi:hypothetical protein
MKEATIKIAGKEVKVAYCYATEILFSDYTGQEFSEFIKEAVVDKNTQSSSKKVLYAILSAIIAYSQSQGVEAEVVDTDIMFNAQPQEIIEAFSVIISLYNDWYKLPKQVVEKANKKKGTKGKN